MKLRIRRQVPSYTTSYSGAPWDGCGSVVMCNGRIIAEDIPDYDIKVAYYRLKYRNWMGGNKRWSRSIVQRWLI